MINTQHSLKRIRTNHFDFFTGDEVILLTDPIASEQISGVADDKRDRNTDQQKEE